MRIWFAKRLGLFLITAIGMSILSFLILRWVPGDPVQLLIGERGASPEVFAKLRANLGLDKPLLEQYFIFVKNFLSGDLGNSIVSQRPVWNEFADRFPATLELSLTALLWSLPAGLLIGMLAAHKSGTWVDTSTMAASLIGYSMPIFWWGLVLIMFFSVKLGWTPVSGRISLAYDPDVITGFFMVDTLISGEGFWSAVNHLILPAFVLGTIPLATVARITRASLLEVLGEEYIKAFKARGFSTRYILFVHALRNAFIPILTTMGVLVGSLLTGAILTETLFSWPGIGRWFVQSVTARDYPVVQSGILLLGLLITTVNLIVDSLYGVVNPRLKG